MLSPSILQIERAKLRLDNSLHNMHDEMLKKLVKSRLDAL